jgi:membrane associated rhomboid family serine protease
MNAASVGHQCPECVSEGRKTQREVRTQFGGTRAGFHGHVTISLIAINCVMQIASMLTSSNPARALMGPGLLALGSNTPLLDRLAGQGTHRCLLGDVPTVCRYGIANGEYYRLFTSVFMHYGLLHLALNMWALWVVGRDLEAMFGRIRFLAIYLVCGLGGSVMAYVFQPEGTTAGASGAIFGLFGVLVFVLRRLKRSLSGILPIIAINLFFTFSIPQISKYGHIGGLITGLVVGYFVTHAPQQRRTQIQAAAIVGATVLLGLAVAWKTAQLHPLPPLSTSAVVGSD